MSNQKNQTKNQLARITAKINQLKRKYPSSSLTNTNSQSLSSGCNLSSTKPWLPFNYQQKSVFKHQNDSNNRSASSIKKKPAILIQNDQKYYENSQDICNQSNFNLKFFKEKQQKSHFNNKYGLNNKENIYFGEDLASQKPFNQYKKELTSLKKQILSSLDIGNFHLSSQNNQIKRKLSEYTENAQVPSALNIQAVQIIQNPQIKTDRIQQNSQQSPVSDSIQRAQQSVSNMLRPCSINAQTSHCDHIQRADRSNTQSNFSNGLEFYSSSFSQEMIGLKKLNQKVSNQFFNYQIESSKRFVEIEGQNNQLRQTVNHLNTCVQTIVKDLYVLKQQNLCQNQFKFAQIQNQNLNKISKQLFREIDTINIKMKQIEANVQLKLEKYQSHYSQNDQQSYLQSTIKQLQNRSFQNQVNSNKINEIESKMLRQIFDMRNEIQLVSQKLRKQDYIEKTLKNLISETSSKNKPKQQGKTQIKQKQMYQNIKSNLTSDPEFIQKIKSQFQLYLQQNLIQEIEQLIQKQMSLIREQIKCQNQVLNKRIEKEINTVEQKIETKVNEKILNYMPNVEKTLNQCWTKMTSYGILIQNMEESFKQLNHESKENINSFKQLILLQSSKILQKCKQMSQSYESSIRLQLQGHKTSIIQEIRSIEIKNEFIQSSLQQKRKYSTEIQNSKISIFTNQQVCNEASRVNSHCSCTRIINYEPAYLQVKPQSKPQSSFLLDQLVKNSLTLNSINF